jgi:hypothetical protein
MAKQKKQASEAAVHEVRSISCIDSEFDRLGLIPEHGIVILSGRRSESWNRWRPRDVERERVRSLVRSVMSVHDQSRP